MYFWSYGLRKTWLDKFLKRLFSEEPLTSNIGLKHGPKHCWNLKDSNFTIFIDPCESSFGWKYLFDFYAKSQECLLTHWLPMTSILFWTEAIFCNILRCNYLQKELFFLNFSQHFWNLHSILNIFRKRATLRAHPFFNLRTPKNVVR